MAPPETDLDLLLSGLPLETQRAAARVLTEWGAGHASDNSFPVRLALITRLQLWALARSAKKLAEERIAISDLLSAISLALAREEETRQAFLVTLRQEERGQGSRLLALAQSIESQGENLVRLLTGASSPSLGAPTTPVNPNHFQSAPRPSELSRRRAAARLLRAALRFDRLSHLYSAPEPLPPDSTPPTPVLPPDVRPPPFNHTGALIALIFLFGLAVGWIVREPVIPEFPNLVRLAGVALCIPVAWVLKALLRVT